MPDAMMYRDSWFSESRASSLNMAFQPRRHLRGEAFTEPALVTFPKTQELEKLGAWELVTDAL